jgi:hypothetical protein
MKRYKDLVLDQGATFIEYVLYQDKTKTSINITGLTPRAQMRKSYYSSNATTFTTTINNNTTGNISISLSYAQTANIKAGRYVYDVELYDANVVYKVQEGTITVLPEVTK